MKTTVLLLLLAAVNAVAAPALSGDYLEVRSCDVFTGACIANSEVGLGGKEATLVWSVRAGKWNGVALDGLAVVAVIRAEATLGDRRYQPRHGRAVLLVDDRASTAQRAALADLARTLGGSLVQDVVETRTAAIEAKLGSCSKMGCATVKAGGLVEINTRCLGEQDHLCGNEEAFYPPLTDVQGAYPAYTELASFTGQGLGVTWQATAKRSAFLATFAR